MSFNPSILSSPLAYLKGVGPQRAELLAKELELHNGEDLLFHFPFRYADRTKFSKVKEVDNEEMYYQLKGIVTSKEVIGSPRQKRLVVKLKDESGTIELVWFQGVQWLEKSILHGQEYVVFGKPQLFNSRFNFSHPEIELAAQDRDSQVGLFPVYSSTEKLKQRGLATKAIAKLTKQLVSGISSNDLPEILPAWVLQKFKLCGRCDAFKWIHYPHDEEQLKQAQRRIKFEELFLNQMSILRLKGHHDRTEQGPELKAVGPLLQQYLDHYLPFSLTNAQRRVLKEVRQNIIYGKQMNRLVQGDVGSGKTMVAFLSMLMAIDNGYQACLMAPTEILAKQHFQTLSGYAEPLGIKIGLLTGSTKAAQRRPLLEGIQNGEIPILIGTHALIEDKVQFDKLGLAVVDEQHKFGVAQRAALHQKGTLKPHILIMTATPIPRTLAMTLYGDLEVSVIDELPPGRQAIKTQHFNDSHRLQVFGFIRDEIAKGRQVYVVYPLIEESEKMDYKDLMDGYESIVRAFPSPQYQVSIVHGKQKAEDKEWEMQRFAKGETQIMVATTVIEVGVNVPNATVMVIESAERFGLSQLHQLRGRVGRGGEQSFCILMTGHKLSNEARTRMRTMVETNDGFKIAEVDLKLRGPGDMSGTQQSGVLSFRLADLSQDQAILQAARETAIELLSADALMERPEHAALRYHLSLQRKSSTDWSKIS